MGADESRRPTPIVEPIHDTSDSDAPDTDAPDTDAPATLLTDPTVAVEAEPRHRRRTLTWVRRTAIVTWALFMGWEVAEYGLAFDRTRLIVLLCLGLIAASIGRRKVITVFLDWAPFAAILLLYDWTRDVALVVGAPVAWHLGPDADSALFGVVPTVWLQEHLRQPTAPWWEVITSVIYMSYFVVPYVLAAVLWLRDRSAWRRFAICFVATTFLALVGYTVLPAAPPWAAARCTAAEVADGPREPPCMTIPDAAGSGGILGPIHPADDPGTTSVERISARGWDYLHIEVASNLVEVGQGKSNLVAAIPSLHAGLTMLLALFMWPRVKALGRTLFVGYAVIMAFTLVYTGEHYVLDIVLGWVLAAIVVTVCRLVDNAIAYRRRAHSEPVVLPPD